MFLSSYSNWNALGTVGFSLMKLIIAIDWLINHLVVYSMGTLLSWPICVTMGMIVILSFLIDNTFSIDINKSLNRLDMSDYGKLDKTMLNYLIISLSNLKRKKKKTQSSVLSECLGKIKHFIFSAKLIIFRRTGQQTNFARVGHEQCDFNWAGLVRLENGELGETTFNHNR